MVCTFFCNPNLFGMALIREIRSICLTLIHEWILGLPRFARNDRYFTYFGSASNMRLYKSHCHCEPDEEGRGNLMDNRNII
jgi:hypothetical protein